MMRQCLLEPIAEFEVAADYLSESADALLRGNLDAGRDYLIQADSTISFNGVHH